MHLTFDWIRNAAAFRALEPHWRDLCTRTENVVVFQTFDWQWRAWEHVASECGHQPRILVGRAGERVVLIWPLVLDRGTVRFLSCEQAEYRDVLVEHGPDTNAWLDAAFDKVIKLPEAKRIVLYDIRDDAQLARLMARRAPSGFRVDRQTALIRLDHWRTWESYSTHLTNRLRADQRRQWRRVDALPGKVRFTVLTDLPDILDAVDWFFRNKLQWLDDRGTAAPSFTSEAYQAFLKATVTDMHARGQLMLGRLASDDEILSVGFGYTFGGVFTFQAYAYNAAFSQLSPSRLLLEQLIRWCLENGINEFDFMPWDMPYKAQWADSTFPIHDYVLPRSLIERLKCELQMLGLGRLTANAWLERQYRRLPTRARNTIRQLIIADWDIGGVVQRLSR